MATIDTILESLGGFGRAQWLIFVAFFSICGPVSMNFMMAAFAAIIPDWTCGIFDVLEPTSFNESTPGFKTCALNGTKCDYFMFRDKPRTMINEWNVICDLKMIRATVISLQMGGVFLGAILGGYFGDSFGRKRTITGVCIFYITVNLVTAFSVNWQMFAAGRFCVGVGSGCSLSVMFPYLVEFIPTRWRSTVVLAPPHFLGYNMCAVAAYFLESWMYLQLVAAATMVPGLIACYFLPESIRWLAVHNRIDEAMSACQTLASVNGKLVSSETRQIIEAIAKEEASRTERGKYTYLDLFKHKYLLKVTVIFCLDWIAVNLIFYGIAFAVSSFSGNFSLNLFFMSVSDMPFIVANYFLLNRIGRKRTVMILFFFCFLASLGCVIVQITVPTGDIGMIMNVLAIASRMVVSSGGYAVQTWCVELYPTVTRNLGYGANNAAGRIGGVLAPFIIDLEENAVLAFIVISAMSLYVVLSSLALPETGGQAMPDTIRQYSLTNGQISLNSEDDRRDLSRNDKFKLTLLKTEINDESVFNEGLLCGSDVEVRSYPKKIHDPIDNELNI